MVQEAGMLTPQPGYTVQYFLPLDSSFFLWTLKEGNPLYTGWKNIPEYEILT